MRREERVTAQGPVQKQQPDGMSHRGGIYLLTYVFAFLCFRGRGGGNIIGELVCTKNLGIKGAKDCLWAVTS